MNWSATHHKDGWCFFPLDNGMYEVPEMMIPELWKMSIDGGLYPFRIAQVFPQTCDEWQQGRWLVELGAWIGDPPNTSTTEEIGAEA